MSVYQIGYNARTSPFLPSSLLMTSSSISPGPPPTPGTLASLSTALSSSCCDNGRPMITDPHTGQSICSCQYGSGLLSAYSRVQGLGESMYSTPHYSTQGYMPSNTDTTAFYSPLHPAQYDTLKDTSAAEAWRGIAQPTSCYPYDPMMTPYPYSSTYGGIDLNGAARRKNATRETTNTLKAWLYEHRKNPYPTKGEKIMLAIITKMTLTQVSTWFANARRRLKKENKMTWSPRNRCGEDEDDDDEEKNDDSGDSRDNESKTNDNKTNNETKDIDSEGVRERPLPKLKETKSLNSSFTSSAESRLEIAVSLSLTPSSVNPQATLVSEMNIGNDFKRFGSPSASSSDSGLSDINGSKLVNGSASDQSDPLRPRIWSLAHVATSTAGLGSPVADLKDHNANLTLGLKSSPNPMSTQTPSYTSTNNSMNMRPWLDTTFNVGSSIFSPVPGPYTTIGGQRPKESLSSMVNHSFTSLNGLSSSNLSRPYQSISNFYNPIRELTKRNTDTMTMSDLHS